MALHCSSSLHSVNCLKHGSLATPTSKQTFNLTSNHSLSLLHLTSKMSQLVDVHPLTHDPTAAWLQLAQKTYKLNVPPPSRPVDPSHVRFVCMSDTHSLTHHIKFAVPDGDVFVHAGDFTKCGKLDEVVEFDRWLGELPHRHKVVIAGNHELSFDATFADAYRRSLETSSRRTGGSGVVQEIPTLGMERSDLSEAVKVSDVRRHLRCATYLEDDAVVLYGIKIYGTPWQPEFCKWAFNVPRGERCLAKWNLIPDDVDVLVTHTPPVGHGDLVCCGNVRAGCVDLLTTVQRRVKPKYHVFGHVHEGYGVTSDGKIIYVNASTCDVNYLPNNYPIVFDIPLPDGYAKT